ncbi:MAG TPA: hypothetical protein VE780_16700, partial [Thermoleophilaceae bacterium]|nr:hypothetical protein [Thermoleophilaceae bacterium]
MGSQRLATSSCELPTDRAVVAVVSADDVALRRTSALLRDRGVIVEHELGEPGDLGAANAGEVDAVVIACGAATTARRDALRALRRQQPEARIVLIT